MEPNSIIYPAKIYRLGENPRTVNAQADLEFWLKEGWTLTPQVYTFQSFPRVMYHVARGSKTVNSQQEVEDSLATGWQMEPKLVSAADDLKAKIVYHTSEVERLQEEYLKLSGEYVPVGMYVPADEPEAEIKEEEMPETVQIQKEVKRRGRPKKVA